ncbi:MAG: YheC/YheD family protein [Patescibacteria group bacterium]
MQNSLLNTRCVQMACMNLGIPYKSYDDNQNFIEIRIHNKPYFFVNFSTPFNGEGISFVCKDKYFTYKLLQHVIRMPRTLSFFDPEYPNDAYKQYVKEKDNPEIVDSIVENFSFPIIVKMNQGSMGRNVFVCNTKSEILQAVETIYKKDSTLYDYIALAQEHISIQKEYRVIIFKREIMLIYEKDFSRAIISDNISPLHQENSKAVLIEDIAIRTTLQNFIEPIFDSFDIQFAGLDIIVDNRGQLYLLEINSKPGFSYFVRDNGEQRLMHMYEDIFTKLINTK